MSTDYEIICPTCRVRHHLGQRFLSGWSFGYGTNDIPGQIACGEFIMDHDGHGLEVMNMEAALDRFPTIEREEK